MAQNIDRNSISARSERQQQYADAATAFAAVPAADKRRAVTMLVAAGITLGVLFLSRLLWLLKPLYDLVYNSLLSVILYYIILGIVFVVFVVFLNRYLKKHCDCRLFAPQQKYMDVPRTLAVIAIGALTVLCISAGFKWKVKIQVEMGSGITMAAALVNLAVYVYYGLHLWLAMIAAALTQRALSVLLPMRYSLPWGGILLVTVFGLTEFVLEFATTAHVYCWIYYILTYVYAIVFELTGRRFHLTYWACIIIMVL